MKIGFYSTHEFEKKYIKEANTAEHELLFIEDELSSQTVDKAKGCNVVSLFSSDKANENVLKELKDLGIHFLTTRSAGTDHIDLEAAHDLQIKVANVPEYSPNAIAEHCLALTLAVCRKLKSSIQRIDDYNFALEGQVGTEIQGKTVGICGTGEIGERLAHIFNGFGAKVVLFDAKENPNLKNESWCSYTTKEDLIASSDIISLNLPLNEETDKFIGKDEVENMKKSNILINTGRGRLVDTARVFNALRTEKLGGFGMDVYENEKGIFYEDLSDKNERDALLQSLIAMDNVVVTAHQAFLTDTALRSMMATTFENIKAFKEQSKIKNTVSIS